MLNALKGILNVFIPIFVAIDVFALMPLFLTLTAELDHSERNRVINQSILTSFLVCLVFVSAGEFVFRTIGVTVDDFKIAGGLVLLIIAVLDIVSPGLLKTQGIERASIGVVPIAVPMIVGPALLTTLIVLLEHYGIWLPLTGLIMNLFVVHFMLRQASYINNLIGKTGIQAISKLMAILLASIAIMMIRIGLVNTIKGCF
ncbi:MAG: MarC family protein [Nitrospirae bacterium]|nr:MAG: MarC family protein [Nitrospirota bacterium]